MSLSKLANLINTSNTQVIFLVGAGISTSSGIPDFRSPQTGLYHNLQRLDLPYAEAVFDIDYYKENPVPFYTLARELAPGQFKPSKFHYMMKLLHDKGKLKRIYTQNIDTLESIAGIPEGKIIEAHGSFGKCACVDCFDTYDTAEFLQKVKDFENREWIKCHCGGLIKPNIVFFGEGLPVEFFSAWEEDLEELNEGEGDYVVITAGTSLTVYPFASLPSEVPRKQVRVLVNKEEVGDLGDREDDMIFLEPSDLFAEDLAKELGWETDFENLLGVENKEEATEIVVITSETKETVVTREDDEISMIIKETKSLTIDSSQVDDEKNKVDGTHEKKDDSTKTSKQ